MAGVAAVSLRRRARQHGATIFFLDEAGFSSERNLGRTYGLKGQTPVVKTSGHRRKVTKFPPVSIFALALLSSFVLATEKPFCIEVVDEATGRGVPMVELE